ncbi:TolB protein [Rhodopirellula maiorica SM1]|uniref:TolB protein n=1 Tax=Rhodopirellula maiorica SM1 TaxID=1265738 RepID=M5RLC4_9BACT|nr:TolB protein [Rhodopirellula maiorica SM1]
MQSLRDSVAMLDSMQSEKLGPRGAAINRHLLQMSADERYDLLKDFTLPQSATDDAACFACLCNVDAPPREFARAIGQRPHAGVFAIPSVGETKGLFSSAWLLVDTAKELGRLHELTEEVNQRTGPHADYLTVLLLIAGARGVDATTTEDRKDGWIERLKTDPDSNAMQAVVVSAVAANSESHAALVDTIATLLDKSESVPNTLKQLSQELQLLLHATPNLESAQLNRDWIRMPGNSLWYMHEGHLTQASAGPSSILYRYPISGDFRFQWEQLASGGRDDNYVGYGGLDVGWEGYRRFEVNRRTIEKQADKVRFWVNGHPVRTVAATETSPWLLLHSEGMPNHRYRNPKMSGSPVVQDEVSMIGEDSRNGWSTYAEQSDDAMWTVKEGVLQSMQTGSPPRQRLLRYVRPLLGEEIFEYEFFSSSDHVVHPALGKLVFLIEPTGVKVHWITDAEREWTGLAEDNALLEPLARRGPRSLPLRDHQWNHVVLKRSDDNVSVTLNDTLIYERAIDELDDTRLGFYHDPSKETVRVRAAKLRGEWPQTFDVDKFLHADGNPDQIALNSVPDLFPETMLRSNTREAMRLASEMELEQRYEFLSGWVLPGSAHPTFRLDGHFVSDDASEASSELQHDADHHRRDHLIAPATELISTAKELGRLSELKTKIQQSPSDMLEQKRARAAMLALVQAAQADVDGAHQSLETLYKWVSEAGNLRPDQLWPEVLVAHAFADDPDAASVLADLLTILKPAAFNDENAIGIELLNVLQFFEVEIQAEDVNLPQIKPLLWVASSPVDAMKRLAGGGKATWIAKPGRMQAIGGHGIEQIFYRYPLEGDVEFEFQHSLRNNTGCQVLIGGQCIQISRWNIRNGPIDGPFTSTKIDPDLSAEGLLLHQRFSVKNGVCTVFANGREVLQLPVQPGFPWIAIRQAYKESSRLLDLRVTGDATIPDAVRLDTDGSVGWRSYYHQEVNGKHLPWRWKDGEIVGQRSTKSAGTGDEQLLYYQRPVCEAASIRYQFYHSEGETTVHPAFDRIAFLLEQDAVAVHRITDGRYDETFSNKVNRKVVSEHQRTAPGDLLRNNEWNAMEVIVGGETIELKLNGESIYVGPLNANSDRTFGLFYFADQSSARVKEVVLRGDWPSQLPTLDRQPLADQTVVQLDTSRDQLDSRFAHDFTREGMPTEFFAIEGKQNATITSSSKGISFAIRSPDKWTQSSIMCNLQMQGDFDVSVDYSDLTLESGEVAIARLIVPFVSANAVSARLSRDEHGRGKRVINSVLQTENPNGGPTVVNKPLGWESTSGTMRMARRGKRLHLLIKDETSSQFRHLETFEVPDTPTQKMRLVTIAQRAGLSTVNWRKIEIHADQLTQIGATDGENRIFVATADGSQIRQITKGIDDLGNHGSPEFSPDGTKVAFDTWTGASSTAHIFMVNIDGTGLRDMGLGLMPTFTPDGKQIAFSTTSGMVMMNLDGSNRRVVSRSGWGIQISPLGDQVAFTDYGEKGPNLYVLDLKTEQKRALLKGTSAERYSQIYWNFDWSADGKELCFVGRNRQTSERELSIVSVNGSQQLFQTLLTGGNYANLAWHPDGDKIMYGDSDPAYGSMSMFLIHRDGTECEHPLLQRRRMAAVAGGEWSRDGKMIALASSVMKTFSKPDTDPDLVPQLDDTRDKLPAAFTPDLSDMAANVGLLKVRDGGATLRYEPQGIAISKTSTPKIPAEIAVQLQILGDFDVIAELAPVRSTAGEAGEVRLVVPFSPEDKLDLQIIYRTNANGGSSLQARGVRDNKERFRESVTNERGYSGLRIARRGVMTHLLCRESQSDDYQVIASFQTGDKPTKPWGLKVAVSSANRQALNVNLKQFSIRADKLLLTDRSKKQFRRVHAVNLDGSDGQQVAGDIPGLGGHGSPKFSPDGMQIAFDTFNHGFQSSHVILVNSDGTNQRDLGQGSMPTFFPDGKRLAFTSNDGLMTMNVDGSDRQLVRRSGHSIKVSHDGKRFAFIDYIQLDGKVVQNLLVMDVTSDQPSPLLVGAHADQFSEIQWNGAWSPDGREFAFRAKSKADNQYQLVVVNTAGSDQGLTVLRQDSRYTCDLGWHPDGKRIFVSRRNDDTGGHYLVLVPRDPLQPDQLIPGQNPFHENFSSGVSPDGQRLVYTSNPLAEYTGNE